MVIDAGLPYEITPLCQKKVHEAFEEEFKSMTHAFSELPPLCVDLDGTLIKEDVTQLLLRRYLKKNPFGFLKIFIWFLKGRAFLKKELSEKAVLDVSKLTYEPMVVELIKDAKKEGRLVVLATAADSFIAHRVADYCGFFDKVIASNGVLNQRAHQKGTTLRDMFGTFIYVGNSKDDLKVWRLSQKAIAVNAWSYVVRRLKKFPIAVEILMEKQSQKERVPSRRKTGNKGIYGIYILLLGFSLLFLSVLFKVDSSTTPVNTTLIPEAINKEYRERPPVALVSFADGPQVFYRNQFSLTESAADKGFDIIYNYRRGHFDPGFYARNKHILEQPRGSGYWLWKPYFILKTMRSLPDDALIFYVDSGIVFKRSLTPLLKKFENPDCTMILMGHGTPTALRRHLKKEAYKAFEEPLSSNVLNHQNIWAFFLAIRNTPENRDFIAKWLRVCEKEEALTDSPFEENNQDPEFSGHGHDQSLLSVLVALNPSHKIIIPRDVLRKEYGIHNFHRHPEEEFTSPLFIMARMPRWLSTVLWNNGVMTKIRELTSQEGS